MSSASSGLPTWTSAQRTIRGRMVSTRRPKATSSPRCAWRAISSVSSTLAPRSSKPAPVYLCPWWDAGAGACVYLPRPPPNVASRRMNDRILRALRREPVDATPVWFMRQAGRTLPRYRESRAERDMFELLRDPAAAAEITRMPLDYIPVDALVLYNDLSTPYFGAGFQLEMRKGVGPVVLNPIQGPEDVARMTPFDPRVTLDYCLDQIRLLKQ